MAYGINEINQAAQSNAQSLEQLGQAGQGAANAVEIERQRRIQREQEQKAKQDQKDYLTFQNQIYKTLVSGANDNPKDPSAFEKIVQEQKDLIENEESLSPEVRQKLKLYADKTAFTKQEQITKRFEKEQLQQERQLINESISVKENEISEQAYSGMNYTETFQEVVDLKRTQLNNGDITEIQFEQYIQNEERKANKAYFSGRINDFYLNVENDIKTEEQLNTVLGEVDGLINEVKQNDKLNEQTKDELILSLKKERTKYSNIKTAEFKQEEEEFNRNLNAWKSSAELGFPVDPELEQELMVKADRFDKLDVVEEVAEKQNFSGKNISEQNAVIQELLSDFDTVDKGRQYIELQNQQKQMIQEDPVGFFQKTDSGITSYDNPTEILKPENLKLRMLEVEQVKEQKGLNGRIPLFSKREINIVTDQINTAMQQGENGIQDAISIVSSLADNNLLDGKLMQAIETNNPDVAKLAYQYNRLVGQSEFTDAFDSDEALKQKKEFLSNQVKGRELSKQFFSGKTIDTNIENTFNDYIADNNLVNGAFSTVEEFKDAGRMLKYEYSVLLNDKLGAGKEIDNEILQGKELDEELFNQAITNVLGTTTINVGDNIILKPHANFEFNGGNFLTHLRNEDPSYMTDNSIKQADNNYSIRLPESFQKTRNIGASPYSADELADKVESGFLTIRTVHFNNNNMVGYQFINPNGKAIGERGGKAFTYLPSPVRKNTKVNKNGMVERAIGSDLFQNIAPFFLD